MSSSKTLRPRSPGLVFAALSVVVLVLVGVLTLTQRQPPPPTIAEFAPQAVEQITDAPTDQSSTRGATVGAGTGTLTDAAGRFAATPPAIDVPRVRKCVGDPPRQVEDPQSPPCVPYWSGDNGGSTWRGVTRDTITIAVSSVWKTSSGNGLGKEMFVRFFNSRFEFYGRKIVVKVYPDAGGDADTARMEADAVYVRDDLGAFADLSYMLFQNGQESQFYDALARYGILSVQNNIIGLPKSFESHLAKFSPYQWNYAQTPDRIQQNLAEVVCKQLAGKPPGHAGPGFTLTAKRKFGLVRRERSDGLTPMDDSIYSRGVKACTGAEVDQVGIDGSQQGNVNAMVRLAAAGATTVVCWCNANEVTYVFAAATGQGYFPEWLLTHYMGNDDDVVGLFFPKVELTRFRGDFGSCFSLYVSPPDDIDFACTTLS